MDQSISNAHGITPPPELVRHWSRFQGDTDPEALWFRIATEAAQWGADQELEACLEWLDVNVLSASIDKLRAARRPKPPSLKEQALQTLQRISKDKYPCNYQEDADWDTIRRALEQLDD